MKPPVAYYGGKSRLAEWIVNMFPPHRVYLEPFAGSAAVLFAKSPSTHEILNDLDGNVVNFYRVLRERGDELERACRLSPYSRAEFAQALVADPDIDDLERARRWFVRLNQSFAKTGSHATGWQASINRGSNNARTVWNRIERFAPAVERLANVVLECRDALECIAMYGVSDAVIYLDPPYLASTRSAFNGHDAGAKRPGGDYAHEFATDEHHRRLAVALATSPATVFLSGYPSPLYDDLYAEWWSVDRRVVRGTAAARGSARPHAIERVWSNRPITADVQLALEVAP